MRKIFYSLLLLVGLVGIISCGSDKPQDKPQNTNEPKVKLDRIPQPPVGLGSKQLDIETTEKSLGSTELERSDAAGYIKLEYQTKDAPCPFRTYLVKKSEDRLKILGLYTLSGESVWQESNTLYPYFIGLFEADGYKYDVRIDHDNQKHHYFVKSLGGSSGEYVECLVKKEVYKSKEYTTYSYRITDVIIG